MQNAHLPILGFVAASGTGKTTLLTQLIPLLTASGVRLGLIKHSHHDFEIDQPGKDSFRLRKAGAQQVMLVSAYRRAVISEFIPAQEPRLHEQLTAFSQQELDLILVEGFKHERFPKIELHRAILKQPFYYPNDETIIALASDAVLELPDSIMWLNLNNPTQIAEFILHTLLNIQTQPEEISA